MPRKGEYSDKYGFHNSSLVFNCGGEAAGHARHGTLTTAGIDGAQPTRFTAERAPAAPLPQGVGCATHHKIPAHPRNPLEPDYHLPEAAPAPAEPSRFLRDTLDVSDIEGARRRQARPLLKETLNLSTADIEGSRPGGGRPPRAQHGGEGGAGAGRRDGNLDVSDISGRGEARPEPAARRREEQAADREHARAESGVGAQKNLEWRKQHFTALREQGAAAAQARHAAHAILQGLPPEAAPAAVLALGAQCAALDRDGSGRLAPREFEAAVQRSGLDLTREEVKRVAGGLVGGDPGGFIEYHAALGSLYARGQEAPAAAAALPPPPGWLASRQRRLKTEVAAAMGQQPAATAAASAAVRTPQEEADAAGPRLGKRIEGLARPGEAEAAGKGTYWFADSAGAAAPGQGEGGGGAAPEGGPGYAYWFAEAGETELAQQHLQQWSPGKDAAIAADVRRMHAANRARGKAAEEPAPAPPPPPPTGAMDRRAKALARQDVALVRELS